MCRIGALHRERLRGGVIRALFAEGRILRRTHRGGQPQASVASEHRVVIVDARIPDAIHAPVGRWLKCVERRGMSWPEAERHARISHRRLERRRHVLHWIEDRKNVRAVLWRSDQRTVCVDRREASIARDQIVEVLLLVHPVAQGDDDVALDTLRPWRFGKGELAFRNAIDPVAVVGERQITQSGELTEHLRAGLT